MSEALAPHPPAKRAFVPTVRSVDGNTMGSAAEQDGLIELLHEVSGETFGLDVVYEALGVVAERFELHDIVVSVESASVGLQSFRLDRKPLERAQFDRLLDGEPFFSEPDIVPSAVKRLVIGLAEVALSTQVARRHQLRDPTTGLLSREVFNEALRAAAAQSSRYGWTFTVMVLRVGDLKEQRREPEVRRLGHAFARALRSGDSGGRIHGSTFGALLPNATSEALHALVRRFLEESGLSADGIQYASATTPNESVDPAELFRLAASRMRDGEQP